MSTGFPFVQVPSEFESAIGKPDLGTHIYRKDGSQEESAAWFDLLTELIGPSVSPGGVGMYCPVSRAAVYKRIKEGKLSIFLFHVTHRKTTLFGKTKTLRDSPYGYVPVSEAQAWRKELEERAVRQGMITQEDLEGSKPDWHGEFLQWRNKKERMSLTDMLRAEGIPLTDLLPDFLRVLIGKKRLTVDFPKKKETKRKGQK
jgi:hypothetical protein